LGVATILVFASSSDSKITPDFAGLKTLNNPPFPEMVAMSSNVMNAKFELPHSIN
jgi:hypothetical protein